MTISQTNFRRMFLSAALIAGIGTNYVFAQSQSAETVIAVTKESSKLNAPATLQVAIFPLELNSTKLKVCLENLAEGYTKVELLDLQGNRLHRPVFVYDKRGIINYDMSQMPIGKYIVKVKNKRESQVYEVKLSHQITPVIEVKRDVLAKAEQNAMD